MDFSLNKEQEMIIKTARDISKSFGPDYWLDKEENHDFPIEFMKTCGEVGLFGLGIPEEYGGTGLGVTEGILAFHELCINGGGMAPAAVYLYGSVFGGMTVMSHGNEEQKKKYLPKIASADLFVCLGLTEPDAGTNTLNISTFAEKDGDEYVVSGNKVFISGFADAGAMVLVARTTKKEDLKKKTEGISMFLVDLPDEAIQSSAIPKHGMNYFQTYELHIDNMRIHKSCLLGEEGKGWYQLLDTLIPERILAALAAVGVGKAAIFKAVEYANQRQVFDCPIGAHQGVQHPLAAAYSKLECAWSSTIKAAVMYDQRLQQKEVGDLANMAKYVAVEAAHDAVYNAMQTLGGNGYTKEYHIERWWREIQLLRIAPIAQQMTLNYVGEHILGMPRSY